MRGDRSTRGTVAVPVAALALLAGIVALLLPAAASANYWTEHRALNITPPGR